MSGVEPSRHGSGPEEAAGRSEEQQRPGRPAGTSWIRFLPSLVVLGVAVVGALGSLELGIGSLAAPGAGLWPMTISVAMGVLAAVSLLEDRNEADLERLRVTQLAISIGSLALFIIAFAQVGVVLPTFLTLVVWLRLLAKESARSTLVIAGIATAAMWLIFGVFLGVPFPAGPFGT